MGEIMNWIIAEGTGHYFFVAFPVCLIILFVLMRGKRVSFLIPSLLMTLVIVNPWFYRKWDSLGLYAYWRILWIVPVIPIVASIIPAIVERIEAGAAAGGSDNVQNSTSSRTTGVVMALIVSVGIGVMAFGGTFLYNGAGGSFINAGNAAKEPDFVVQIADTLLGLDENPRVVFQHPIGTYVRQYTGKIDQLFGRNIDGFIFRASSEASTVNSILNDPGADLSSIATLMANDDYKYLVVNNADREAALDEAGFTLIDAFEGFGIYEVHEAPALIKERNDLGQVIRVTTVDEARNPIDDGTGYATISYDYDDYGNVIREFRMDVNGNGVANVYGEAGYERQYDSSANIVLERVIDETGAPIINPGGYAEIRRQYDGQDLIEEAYYDLNGNLVNRTDKGYAVIKMEYDNMHRKIVERYLDISGNPVLASCGYAMVKREYDEQRVIREAYFDERENPVLLAMGYASIYREYDGNGYICLESYYNEVGDPTNCINGYAHREQTHDSQGNIVIQRFLNDKGEPVITAQGYAEVRRSYDGKRLVREEYYGAMGEPLVQAAGHVAIEQAWDKDKLISRTYLGIDGVPVNRVDGYAKVVWEKEENKSNEIVKFYDLYGNEVNAEGLNLVDGIHIGPDGWSEWMIPGVGIFNSTFSVGQLNLGEKSEGTMYTSRVEIEFRNVTATEGQPFLFQTQGPVDGKWSVSNIWYPNVVNLLKPPEDGIYQYISTTQLNEQQANASTFQIGFRCDYWRSGTFRIRNLRIENGETANGWGPGL